MLGESDLIYTSTLCGLGTLDYKGKEILILGGGDGGILHELLKEQPKYITMAEVRDSRDYYMCSIWPSQSRVVQERTFVFPKTAPWQ